MITFSVDIETNAFWSIVAGDYLSKAHTTIGSTYICCVSSYFEMAWDDLKQRETIRYYAKLFLNERPEFKQIDGFKFYVLSKDILFGNRQKKTTDKTNFLIAAGTIRNAFLEYMVNKDFNK